MRDGELQRRRLDFCLQHGERQLAVLLVVCTPLDPGVYNSSKRGCAILENLLTALNLLLHLDPDMICMFHRFELLQSDATLLY